MSIFKLLFISVFLIALDSYGQQNLEYEKLIRLKKGYKVLLYPNSFKQAVSALSIMDPGLSLISLNGGIYIPGLRKWLIEPNLQKPILASSFFLNATDTILLLVTYDSQRQKMLVEKTKYIDNSDSSIRLFNMPVSQYSVRVYDDKTFFLWGIVEGTSAIWKSDFKRITPIFYSSSTIKDVDVINENNLIVALDSSVVRVGMNVAPETLFKIDLPVESVAIDKYGEGAVFVSTSKGIVRFNSVDKDDVDVITEVIHGKLKIFQNKLFILWAPQNQVVEIKIN